MLNFMFTTRSVSVNYDIFNFSPQIMNILYEENVYLDLDK